MRLFLLISLLFWANTSFSQDLIIPKNGEPIKAYNTEVGSAHVFYQLNDDPNADIIRIAKINVLMIRKVDGSVLNLATNASKNIEEEVEDDGFPLIPEDSIKGLLIAEGNCVFVPTDSPNDYERAGQETLKVKIKEWGYWNVVNKPEKSHFILQYVTNTRGHDTSWLVLRPRKYYRISKTIVDRETAGLQLVYTGSNEDIENNKRMSEKLFNYIKKELSDTSVKESKFFIKPKLNKILDATNFEEGSKKIIWSPQHVF